MRFAPFHFFRCYGVEAPIIIFDVMSLNSLLLEQFTDQLVFGGRHWICTEFLDRLFSAFTDLGVELVFFIDGFVQDDKYRIWSKRQNRKYKDHTKLLDRIYENDISSKEITEKFKYSLYNNGFMNVIEKSCTKFGRLIHAVTYECDKEAASFAFANSKVLAIFSNDTDFLIFPGSWSYYSTKDINIESFQTKMFSRAKFRQHFNLSSTQLAIFGSIVGNDFIPVESLRSFHKRIANDQNGDSSLLLKIADFIKKSFVEFAFRDYSKMIKFFSTHAFSKDSPVIQINLAKSVSFYQVDTKLASKYNNNHLLSSQRVFTYNVLQGNPFNFSLIFFDLRMKDLGNYYNLAVPMFRRQAGAMLKMNSRIDGKLKIRTKLSHCEKYKEFTMNPEFPPFDLPTIEEMHSEDSIYNHDRNNLLKWIIDWNKFKYFNIENLPENFVVDIITIIFLRQQEIISCKEADLLLWVVKNSTRYLIPKFLQFPKTLDPRAFRISFLYVRMYANVERSLEVCGLSKNHAVSFNF